MCADVRYSKPPDCSSLCFYDGKQSHFVLLKKRFLVDVIVVKNKQLSNDNSFSVLNKQINVNKLYDSLFSW